MFDSKKKQLFQVNKKASAPQNSFVQAGLKDSAETVSGNNALKYKTTGNPFVDQFGVLGQYKSPRPFADIANDCELLWAADPEMAVKFTFYLRTITRKVQLFDGKSTTEPQKGAQLKHEAIMRMLWLNTKSHNTFMENIGLFISVGSWKDIITMLQYDLIYHGWDGRVLNWDKMGKLISELLRNKNTCELIKKYLPQLRSNNKCTTVEAQADNMIAKWLCNLFFEFKTVGCTEEQLANIKMGNYKKYRKLKATGTAHEWQKLISRGQFDKIEFERIHGRALNQLVKGKFLENQKLKEKYTEFVKKPETKSIKFTGFVHELMEMCTKYNALSRMPVHEQETVNKQFATLIEKGGEKQQSKFIVVRDTSASMSAPCKGANTMNCYNVGKSLALYFSEFLTGEFQDTWIEFNESAEMHTWIGKTPCEKWFNDHSSYVGSTNFQSVVDLFCRLRRTIPEEDFPTGILCISDGEFNPSDLNETNVETAKKKLSFYFSKEYVDNFVIVLWNLQSNYYSSRGAGNKFETFGNVPNTFYFSGFDASIISFLTSKIKTPIELIQEVLDQEILNLVKIY